MNSREDAISESRQFETDHASEALVGLEDVEFRIHDDEAVG